MSVNGNVQRLTAFWEGRGIQGQSNPVHKQHTDPITVFEDLENSVVKLQELRDEETGATKEEVSEEGMVELYFAAARARHSIDRAIEVLKAKRTETDRHNVRSLLLIFESRLKISLFWFNDDRLRRARIIASQTLHDGAQFLSRHVRYAVFSVSLQLPEYSFRYRRICRQKALHRTRRSARAPENQLLQLPSPRIAVNNVHQTAFDLLTALLRKTSGMSLILLIATFSLTKRAQIMLRTGLRVTHKFVFLSRLFVHACLIASSCPHCRSQQQLQTPPQTPVSEVLFSC